MPASLRRVSRLALVLLSLPGLVGCGAGGGPGPTPSTGPSPNPVPSPSGSPAASPAAFSIEVLPAELPVEVRALIPGVPSSFLVVVGDGAPGAGPVEISARAEGATIIRIVQPTTEEPVAEVWFSPDPATTETAGSIAITAARGGVTLTEGRTFHVFPMTDERAADARPHFERWVAWLAGAHPELGITAETTWQPRFVSTLLVVSHYAYDSEAWELTVAWHNMIPPDDWSEIHLRRRGVDGAPSLAFRQDSVSGKTTPRPVLAPEAVVR